MAKGSPEQIAQRWATRLGAATQDIQAGVQAVTVSPGAAAARQKQVWVQNVQAAADKWATRVANLSLQDWQNAMINKGVARIGAGAQASQPKFANFMGQLLPYIDRAKASLPPRGTLDQNLARSQAFGRAMSQFRRGGNG